MAYNASACDPLQAAHSAWAGLNPTWLQHPGGTGILVISCVYVCV